MENMDFTEEQKHYLQGFAAGSGLLRTLSLDVLPGTTTTQDAASDPNRAAQEKHLAEGKKLTPEESAKRKIGHGLDIWDEVVRHAREGKYPKGTDVFLFKFQGMFYVTPAQDSFMCRLRVAGGIMSSHQLRGVATLAQEFAGGYADLTTRANLQLREITAKHTVDVLLGLHELGIINRGSGADNIRNITCSPTAGIDPQELIDTRPLARQMHHYILNHREMYGLPRKFNIAFDGGGAVSALEDTNDIGFTAMRHKSAEESVFPDGVGFRLTLGGITGHKDFARDTGIMLSADECIPVAAAIVRAFIEHGDRTDRKKARLKYVLDRMGFDAFILEVEKHLGSTLRRVALEECDFRPPVQKHGHIGVHAQKQPGLSYIGVVLPVGRITCAQMRAIADIADRHGSGTLRLTVWQNLLISDIPNPQIPQVQSELEAQGIGWSATGVRGGLVACTGNAGCKYASSNTKKHAIQIADYLDARVQIDHPINIHLTGCPHSCAQHYIGDIGLLATKVSVGEEMLEGYHIFVGGGYGAQQEIGRELFRDVLADDAPATIKRMLRTYLEQRAGEESFRDFVKRLPTEQLREVFENQMVNA
jgi:ferredoxin-nitrite reductase